MTRISAFRFTNVIKILSVLSATLMCFIAPTIADETYKVSYNDGIYTFSSGEITSLSYSFDADYGKACFGWFNLYLANPLDNTTQQNAGYHECINGCKANYYYVTINYTNRYTIFGSYWNSYITNIKQYDSCAKCPKNATCEQTDGHKESFTCNKGYFESDYKCNACPTGAESCTSGTVYQCPNNSYDNGNGCTQCPELSTPDQAQQKCVCDSGYYMSNKETCESCPAHANCDTKTDFTCNDGYYKNDNKCESCPKNASSCTSATDFTCKADYYKDGSQCTKCPPSDDVFTDEAKTTKAQYTSNTGAKSKTDCYLKSGTYYNEKGTFTLSNQCNWEQKN